MKVLSPALGAALALILGPAAAQEAADPGRTIIVLDASGSMWGAIDGRPKLEIARETVARVLEGIDPARELGLMAYGHRRRGDCADIELIVPPAPGTAAAIVAATAEMRFQGRTPLTDAVRAAAQALNYTEDRATVVLVTDGVETCEADPCALARELEAAGIGFTAHVVGFGLTAEEGAQVSCLAEDTGGVYAAAGDAETLLAALTATVAAPAPMPEEPALATGPWFEGAPLMADVAIAPTGRTLPGRAAVPVAAFDFPADGDAALCQAICADDTACHAWRHEPPGSLFVAEARCFTFDDAAEFVWAAEPGFSSGLRAGHTALTTAYEPAAGAPGDAGVWTLSAASTLMAGEGLVITWTGPRYTTGDYIDIAPPGLAGPEGYLSWAYTDEARAPVTLALPAEPGTYEIRYVEATTPTATVRARQTVTLTPLVASVTAPDRVAPGETFAVAWDGPFNPRHWVTLVPPQAAPGAFDHGYFYLSEDRTPGQLTAPEAPGTYEVRYVLDRGGSYLVAARRTITVAPAPEPAPVTPPLRK